MLMTMLEKITLIGLFGPLWVGRGRSTNAGPSPMLTPQKGLLDAFGEAEHAAGREFRESQGPIASTASTPPARSM
jgi:hypothetical protein